MAATSGFSAILLTSMWIILAWAYGLLTKPAYTVPRRFTESRYLSPPVRNLLSSTLLIERPTSFAASAVICADWADPGPPDAPRAASMYWTLGFPRLT